LDLQGGSQLTLQIIKEEGKVTKDELDAVNSVIDRRVNNLGVSESNLQTLGGDQLILELPRKGKLNDGDILLTNKSNFYVEIIAKIEDLIEISSTSKIELIKTAYHLGNRHVEVEIEEDILLTKGDYVIENMLKNFNVDFVNIQKKFFPEKGAHSHE